MSRLGVAFFAAAALLAAVDTVVLWPQIRLLAVNARAGCFPWSPPVVEFRQGMNICPGQVARIAPFPALPLEPLPPGVTFPSPDMTLPLTPVPEPKKPAPPCSHEAPCNFEFRFTFPLGPAPRRDMI